MDKFDAESGRCPSRSFFLGLIEAYGYGWYATLVWVPIYNVLARQPKQQAL